MTVAPLRPEPVVVTPNELKKKSPNKKLIVTMVIAAFVFLAAVAAVYITVRTLRRDRDNQTLERPSQNRNRRNLKQSQSSSTTRETTRSVPTNN